MTGGRPPVMPSPSVTNGSVAKHRVEPHILPHLCPLLFVVHEQLAIAEVLAFFLALGGDEHPPHRDSWSTRPCRASACGSARPAFHRTPR